MCERPGPMPACRRQALFARYVTFAERRTGTILVSLLAVAAAALFMALRLELHTDMAELLPDSHPAVVALRRIASRQKSATNLVMLVRSPSAEADRAFAVALRPELEKLVPASFSEIQWSPDTEIPAFA